MKLFMNSFVLLSLFTFSTLEYYDVIEKKYYSNYNFNIETIKSNIDKNKNGVDDYTDILIGAKKDAKNKPKYVNAYYAGGYPPDNEGVCTDVIWRSFLNAGYNLKDMVDNDIRKSRKEYPSVSEYIDPNIDFRRVGNLHIFFRRNAITLTNDIYDIDNWQAGDIVVFGSDEHIGIVSDKRNAKGIPYLIHNNGQPNREEDIMLRYIKKRGIIGHFRWKATN